MDAAFDLENYIMHEVTNGQQWHILPFLPPVQLPGYLSRHALMLLLGSAFLILVLCVLARKTSGVPGRLTNLLEIFVIFIRDDIAVNCLGEHDGKKMTPLLCTFFFLILCLNLLGLIPAFSTATSNVNITGSLALITLGFMIF